MNRADIKIKTMVVFRRGKEILVNEVPEPDGTVKGYRPPGGHVEFGEKAVETIAREVIEELQTEGENFQLLSLLENLFTYGGKPHHEIVFIFTADFKDKSFYDKDHILGHLEDGTNFDLFWMDPAKCSEGLEIYPKGLAILLT
jgi:ADP-ribose pyrophosphatase YjhB (NUDIX family)